MPPSHTISTNIYEPQPSKRLLLYVLLAFNCEFSIAFLYLLYIDVIDFKTFLSILMSISGIITILINNGLSILVHKIWETKIRNFQTDDQGVEKANRMSLLYQWYFIIYPIICTTIAAPLVTVELGIREIYHATAFILGCYGAVFLIAPFFFLLALKHSNTYLVFLPFNREYQSSHVGKGFAFSALSCVSMILCSIVPFIAIKYNGHSLDYTLIHSVLPPVSAAVVFALSINHALWKDQYESIQRLIRNAQTMSEGDFRTEELEIASRDVFGVLTGSLNLFHRNTVHLLSSIKNNTVSMKQVGEILSGTMNDTAQSIQHISGTIDEVKQKTATQSSSVTETAATVEQIIKTIRKLNTSIAHQAASVAQSSSAVEQMTANITSITHTLDKTNDAVKSLAAATADGKETITNSSMITQKLAEESGSLLEASSVIQHIASQTNLLAMNAAIEAAHAGESGKGFAVVADEIRKLAEESSVQGKTITATLKTLSGEIETLSESSKIAGDKFNTIFTLSEQVKEMSDHLMCNMQEQENGSREVLNAIKTINMVTAEVQAGSDEMLSGGEGVAQEMQKLDNLTRIIVDSMNEITAGAAQIINAVREVNAITQQNKNAINNLVEEVSKFKLAQIEN